jgi:hypothetical protein
LVCRHTQKTDKGCEEQTEQKDTIWGIDVHLGRFDINITVSIKDLRQSSWLITISIDSILVSEGKLRRYGRHIDHSELHTWII